MKTKIHALLCTLGVTAALALGASAALAGPSAAEAAKCPSAAVGTCISTADCKSTCQARGYPITQSICSGNCCFCSL